MATKSLTIEILGDSRSAQKAFKDVDQTQETFGKKLGGLAKSAGALAVGAGLVKFGKDSAGAFAESEGASNRLADAFSKFPKLADSNVGAFEKLAEARAKVTRFDDDATKSGQAALAQFGLTGEEILKLTPLMQDYAAKTGKSLPDAAETLGKAVLGKGKALSEVGIAFKDTGDRAGNLEQIMGGLRDQVGGFAEKEGKTGAGRAEILKNQFGEVQEMVGSKLVPAMTKLAEVGVSLLGWVSNLSPGMQQVLMVGVGLVAAIAAIVKVTQMWTAVQGAFNVVMAMNPVVLVVLAIVALIAVVVLAYQKVDWFRNFVDAAFRFIGAAIGGVVEWVKANWPLLLAILTGPIGIAVLLIVKHWDTIKDAFTKVKDWIGDRIGDIVGFVTSIPGRIGDVARTMWDGIKNAFTAVKDWVRDRIGDIIGFVTGIKDGIRRVAGGMFDAIKDAFKTSLNGLIWLWNKLDFGINISVPDWVPGVGGKGFRVDDIFPDIGYFDSGGVVGGPRGSPQLAVVHGGETILPTHRGGGAGGGLSVTVPVSIDGREVAKATVRFTREELLRMQKGRQLGFGT